MKGKALLLRLAAMAAALFDVAVPVRAADGSQASAELVVVNSKVWTGDAARPEATALAVAGERLVVVGSDAAARALVGEATRVIDAGGRRVVPGFHDAHVHLVSGGFALLAPELRDAPSREELVRRLGAYAATLPPGAGSRTGDGTTRTGPALRSPTAPGSTASPVIIRSSSGGSTATWRSPTAAPWRSPE